MYTSKNLGCLYSLEDKILHSPKDCKKLHHITFFVMKGLNLFLELENAIKLYTSKLNNFHVENLSLEI